MNELLFDYRFVCMRFRDNSAPVCPLIEIGGVFDNSDVCTFRDSRRRYYLIKIGERTLARSRKRQKLIAHDLTRKLSSAPPFDSIYREFNSPQMSVSHIQLLSDNGNNAAF